MVPIAIMFTLCELHVKGEFDHSVKTVIEGDINKTGFSCIDP